MSSPAISKHLRVLERAGLVEQGRQAQWRPRRLLGRPLKEAADWLQAYRPFWEERSSTAWNEVLQRMKAARAVRTPARRRSAASAAPPK